MAGPLSLFEISGRAMAAQLVRLNTTASNLANAGTVAGSEASAFRAMKPVFRTIMGENGKIKYEVIDTTPGRMLMGQYLPKNVNVSYKVINKVQTKKDISNVIEAVATGISGESVAGQVNVTFTPSLKLAEGAGKMAVVGGCSSAAGLGPLLGLLLLARRRRRAQRTSGA